LFSTFSLAVLVTGCGGGSKSAPTPEPTVAWTNFAPLAATDSHPYTFIANAQGPKGGQATFSLLSGPAGATLQGNSLAWTPDASQAGKSFAFRLQATADGVTGVLEWTVAVAANALPVFSSTPDQLAKEAHLFQYSPKATDADGDTVSFSFATLPAGATFSQGKLTWIPTPGQVGASITFTLVAEDGHGGRKEQSWTLSAQANTKPAFSSQPGNTAKEGHAYAYQPLAVDLDGDPVTLKASKLPQGASFMNGALAWTPAVDQVGLSQEFVLVAEDGLGGATLQSWTITPAANAIPLFTSNPPADVSFSQGVPSFDYALTASDADNDVLSFTLLEAPAGATLTGSLLSWKPRPEQERTAVTFRVKVADGAGGTKEQSWTKAYSGNIRGTWHDRWVDEVGTVTSAPDDRLSNHSVVAQFFDVQGILQQRSCLRETDGSFSIIGVPAGNYWLRRETLETPEFLWTGESTLDLGRVYGGRADQSLVKTSYTPAFTLNLTNLAPWGDPLRWFIPKLGWYGATHASNFSANGPLAGDTAVVNGQIASLPYYWPLINGNKGDKLTLIQTAPGQSGLFTYTSPIRQMAVPAFTQVEGQAVSISGAFQTLPTSPCSVQLNADSFRSLATSVHPAAKENPLSFEVFTQPVTADSPLLQSRSEGTGFGYPRLLNGSLGGDSSSYNLSLSMGDPSPSGWLKLYRASAEVYAFGDPIPGTTNNSWTHSFLQTIDVLPPSPDTPLAARISPPRTLRINGLDLQQPQTGVGLNPTLSWTAPALGTPSIYRIEIVKFVIAANSTQSNSTPVATLWTRSTTITLPNGVIEAGQCFTVVIHAESNPLTSGQRPFAKGFPFASAGAHSALITP